MTWRDRVVVAFKLMKEWMKRSKRDERIEDLERQLAALAESYGIVARALDQYTKQRNSERKAETFRLLREFSHTGPGEAKYPAFGLGQKRNGNSQGNDGRGN